MSVLLLHCITTVRRIAHLPKSSMSVLVNTADHKEDLVRDEWGVEEKNGVGVTKVRLH